MVKQEQRVPDGIPLTQSEWDRLSDTSRRWIVETASTVKEEGEAKERREAQSSTPGEASISSLVRKSCEGSEGR